MGTLRTLPEVTQQTDELGFQSMESGLEACALTHKASSSHMWSQMTINITTWKLD
jgi:hypothetical protein